MSLTEIKARLEKSGAFQISLSNKQYTVTDVYESSCRIVDTDGKAEIVYDAYKKFVLLEKSIKE